MTTAALAGPAAELRLVPGLTSAVTAVAFSPAGRWLASGQADGTVRLWDPRSGGEWRALDGGGRWIIALAFSIDGDLLVSAAKDGKRGIRVWDVANGTLLHELDGAGSDVAFSPDGRWLAEANGLPSLWNARAGKRLRTFSTADRPAVTRGRGDFFHAMPGTTLRALSFSNDGRYLISGFRRLLDLYAYSPLPDTQGGLWIWKVAEGQMQHLLRQEGAHIYAPLSPHPDGRRLASGGSRAHGRQHGVWIWDLETRQTVRTLEGLSDEVNALAWSPDGQFLAAGNGHTVTHGSGVSPSPPTLGLWDADSGERLHRFGDHDSYVYALAWSPDSRHLATATATGLILWEAASGRPVWDFFSQEISTPAVVGFDASGQQVFAASSDGEASFWSLRTAERSAARWPMATPTATTVAATADGSLVVSASQDDAGALKEPGDRRPVTFYVWSAAEGLERRFAAHDFPVQVMALSPDGRRLASAAGGYSSHAPQNHRPAFETELEIWNPRTGRLVHSLYDSAQDPRGGPRPGQYLEGRGVFDRHVGRILAMEFSPDGKLLATAGGSSERPSELILWSVSAGEPRAAKWNTGDAVTQNHAAPISALAFSHQGQGRRLATGDTSGTIKWWSLPEGGLSSQSLRLVGTLAGGQSAHLTALVWIDEETLASGDANGIIRLWDLASGQQKAVLAGHRTRIADLAAHPDAATLVSASIGDRNVRLWDVDKGEERLGFLALKDSDDTIAFTPDLHYLATRGSRQLIFFTADDRVLPFEQFDLRLHRPAKVLARLPNPDPELITAYARAHERRLQLMGLSDAELGADLELPTLELRDGIDLPNFTSLPQIRLGFAARTRSSELDSLHVWVNGVPLHGAAGLALDHGRCGEFDVEIPLSAGENRIEAMVRNRSGTESLLLRRRIVCERSPEEENLYLVAVGVSLYEDGEDAEGVSRHLAYAAKDAEDLAALFERSLPAGRVHSHLLIDHQARREQILAARSFLESATLDDRVVVFVAGHGLIENGEYLFAPHDMNFEIPDHKGITYDELEGLLDGLASRKKLLLIDTCRSGEFEVVDLDEGVRQETVEALARGGRRIPNGRSEAIPALDKLFVDLRRSTGTTVIAASGRKQYAYERHQLGNGVFTYTVRRGIMTREADSDGDGQILASELRDYVTYWVQEITANQQRPTLRRENLAHDFRVW